MSYNKENAYQISQSNPGYAIIFNNRNFVNSPESNRSGSEKDVERLSNLFYDLNFEVELNLDLYCSDTLDRIKDYSVRDYSSCSCIIIFIMSHGGNGTIETIESGSMHLNHFMDPFKTNNSLKNKPKLFFIQSCRGNKEMAQHNSSSCSDSNNNNVCGTKVPIEADYLYAYSTVEGYYSYRDPKSGSWFIQTLCDVISKQLNSDGQHILDILTDVSSLMTKKEIIVPTFESRLTKRFYFYKNSNRIHKNIKFSNGDEYEGQLKDNQLDGNGTYSFSNGDKYVGQFKSGSKNGYGEYYYKDGSKYIGEWKNNIKNGRGTFYYLNSDKYFGEFQDGKRHGKGRYYYSDGDQHFGDWKYDLKHGFGNLFDSSGKTKLMGDWIYDKPPESSCLIS